MKTCEEVLKDFTDDIIKGMPETEGYELPSIDELCKIYNRSRRVVHRALAELIQKGIIKSISIGKYIVINTDYPKYNSEKSIEKKLANDILDFKYQNGNGKEELYHLPTRSQIAMVYNCSEKTAGKALNILIKNGIIISQKGIGYFITKKGIEKIIAKKNEDIVNEFDKIIRTARNQGLEDSRIEELFYQSISKEVKDEFK